MTLTIREFMMSDDDDTSVGSDEQQELADEIQEITKDETKKFLAELPKLVSRRLDNAAMHALGFKRGWGSSEGTWEIERSSQSFIGQCIEDRAKEAAKTYCNRVFTAEVMDSMYEQLEAEIIAQLKHCFEREVYSAARSKVEALAAELADRVTESSEIKKLMNRFRVADILAGKELGDD